MCKRSNALHIIALLIGLGIILILNSSGDITSAQAKRTKKTSKGTSSNTCRMYNYRFSTKVENPITMPLSLQLRNCTVSEPDSDFFNAEWLEIAGDKISLKLPGVDEPKSGEVSAYALSRFCLNANIAFMFGRGTPDQRIYSLRLTEYPLNNFELLSAPSAPRPTVRRVRFNCESSEGTDITPR